MEANLELARLKSRLQQCSIPRNQHHLDMPATSTDVATSCQLTSIGIEKYLDCDILHMQNIWSDHVNGRADSGGHGPPEESSHGSTRKTDEDREPDYNQSTGTMPSSHPCTSESDYSLSDDFLTPPNQLR